MPCVAVRDERPSRSANDDPDSPPATSFVEFVTTPKKSHCLTARGVRASQRRQTVAGCKGGFRDPHPARRRTFTEGTSIIRREAVHYRGASQFIIGWRPPESQGRSQHLNSSPHKRVASASNGIACGAHEFFRRDGVGNRRPECKSG